MPDRPRTIAEMLEATVARQGDGPALAAFDMKSNLRWWNWQEIGDHIREALRAEEAHRANSKQRNQGTPNHGGMLPDYPRAFWYTAALVTIIDEKPSISPWSAIPSDWVLPCNASVLQKTSGTSGTSRWCVISEGNLTHNTVAVAESIIQSLGDSGFDDEVRLSFLPTGHLYALVCDLLCWVYRGSKIVLAESRDTIFRDCQLAKPTAINGVPYFFQKVIDLAEREKTPIKKLLGGEIRRCYCGGAALSPAVEQRFWDEGVPLLNGYGLSEASPVVTVSTIKDYKLGTVGKPLPGVDVRIADDGEVLVRGPNVMMGYWGPDGIDQAATAEVIKDDWLHTGDLGSLDADGFLTIHGRKKETLVLSTGKNVSPSRIEALLCASPWIEQCAVVGDGRKHLAAIVVPNPDRVRAEVKRRRLWVWSKKSALRHPAIRSVFQQEIAERLAGLPRHEQVRAFTLLPRGFSQDGGEITTKLSLRRQKIEEVLAAEIKEMYASSPSLAGRG